MSPLYLRYLLWRAGRAPNHQPNFFDLSCWLNEGSPPVGQVQITHNVVHHNR